MQEARAASALRNPNIISIYDFVQENGQDFIIMEYVPGTTLDRLIGRKGLPVDEALRYAVQIADGLASAHAAGIVHRDMKPGNVAVEENGRVKILDFGLAKLIEAAATDGMATRTLRTPITADGVVTGTLAYMSPEQAEGARGGRAIRHLQLRRDAVRDADRPPCVRAHLPGIDDSCHIARRAAAGPTNHPRRSRRSSTVLSPAACEKTRSGDISTWTTYESPWKMWPRSAGERRPSLRRRGGGASGPGLRRGLSVLGAGGGCDALCPEAAQRPCAENGSRRPPGRNASDDFPRQRIGALRFRQTETRSPFRGVVRGRIITISISNSLGVAEPLRLTTLPGPDYAPAWSPDGRWIAFLRGAERPELGGPAAVVLIPAIGGPERHLAEYPARRGTRSEAVLGSLREVGLRSQTAGTLRRAAFSCLAREREKRRITSPPEGAVLDGDAAFSPDGRKLIFVRVGRHSTNDLYVLGMAAGS